MKVKLRPFQETAVAEVLSRLESAKLGVTRSGAGQRQAVGLTAATGAGKTIIATAVIERSSSAPTRTASHPDPDAVFLWMTDLPELNTQTQGKMLDAWLRPALRPPAGDQQQGDRRDARARAMSTSSTPRSSAARRDLVKKGPLVGRAFTFWDVITPQPIEDRGPHPLPGRR